MEYLFLILIFIVFLVLESILDNIVWIGAIAIILIVASIVKASFNYREFGFDFADFLMLLMKLGAIVGIICLMCT